MSLKEIEDYLEQHHLEIKNSSDRVLNVWVGTKIVNGVDTGEYCIRVIVDKKLKEAELKIEEIIPKFHGGFKTDIVELKPEGWVAGKTEISRLSPKEQVKKLGAKSKIEKPVNHTTTDYEIDWRKSGKLIEVRNQGNCGSCVGFAVTNTWSDNLSILKGDKVLLSPQHIFFCGGGSCENGSVPVDLLQFGVDVGCALDNDCPYVSGDGKDEPCGYGLAKNWYKEGKLLDSFTQITNVDSMKEKLKDAPLLTTMNVYQSFFNYTSGVYKPIPNDTLVGGHAIETVGCSDSGKYWVCKNQWGTMWGEEGYFQIGYGECGIDSDMYSVALSDVRPNVCVAKFEQVIADLSAKEYGKVSGDLEVAIECLVDAGIVKDIFGGL